MSGDLPSFSRPSHSVTLSPFTPDERALSILPVLPAASLSASRAPLTHTSTAMVHSHGTAAVSASAAPSPRRVRATDGKIDRRVGGMMRGRRRRRMARRWENTSARGKRMAGGAVGSVEVARECGARAEEEEKDRPDAHLSRCQRCSRPARPRLPPLAVLARRRATAPRVNSAALL